MLIFSQNASALNIPAHINPQPIKKFISVSDIHFNPFASCTALAIGVCPIVSQLQRASYQEWGNVFERYDEKYIAGYGQDTNYALLKSALIELRQVDQLQHPVFSVILGDFLAHNFREQYILYAKDHTQKGYRRFVKKTLQFLTYQIRQAISHGDIYPVIGNNDSYTGDYDMVPGGDFFRDAGETWMSFIKNKQNQQYFQNDFPYAGYYTVTLPSNNKQMIIVLNTVLFSTLVSGPQVKQAATDELRWLRNQLASAEKQHQSVLLIFHIPMGVNVYATLKSLFGRIEEFWQPIYNAAFGQDLQAFSCVITAILPGHIHMDGFQLVGYKQPQEIPVSFTPAISPIFGNNPGFKVYSYNASTFQLVNFETYYYPLNIRRVAGWEKEYNFIQVYRSLCTHCDLTSGMQSITPTGELAKQYQQYYPVGSNQDLINKNHFWLPYYWCDIHAFVVHDYKKCIQH